MIDLSALVRHPAMQALGWTLVHFVWQGAALGLAAFLILRVVRPAQASARYLIGVATLGAMLAAPVATFVALRSAQPAALPGVQGAIIITPASTPRGSGVTGWVIADLTASPS